MPEAAEGVGLAKKSASSPRAAFSLARKSAMGSSDMVYGLWWSRKRCIVVVVTVACSRVTRCVEARGRQGGK